MSCDHMLALRKCSLEATDADVQTSPMVSGKHLSKDFLAIIDPIARQAKRGEDGETVGETGFTDPCGTLAVSIAHHRPIQSLNDRVQSR